MPVSDERPPAFLFPVHVLQAVLGRARLPAEQHHHAVCLRWDEPKHEDISRPAAVAFEDGFPEWAILVQGHLLVLRPHQMVHNVRPGRVSSRVAEPTLADVAVNLARGESEDEKKLKIYQGGRVVDATVGTGGAWHWLESST